MPAPRKTHSLKRPFPWLYLFFVILLAFFTYVWRYTYPPQPFWDEPYHIASAEKYLSGVFFMEQHPPLGKLLIALGEKIVDANEVDDQFVNTDYAVGFPPGFSFAGYRLLPTLLAWFTAPLLFLIFYFLTRSGVLSSLLSFLYVFDTAAIVHSRGVMVDSPLTFFGILCVLLFLHVQQKREGTLRLVLLSLALGAAFAAAFTTKLVGLIFILLFPAALVRLYPDWRKIVLFFVSSSIGFLLIFLCVWMTHFALGDRVVPELSNNGYYEAGESYKKILSEQKNGSLLSFPVMMRDSIKFVGIYNRGVPRLDLCKPDENGSPAYFWPFGARTINYRWEKTTDDRTRHLYLVANPAGWALGLAGIVLSVVLLLGSVIGPKQHLRHSYLMLTMLALYFGYMVGVSMLGRVMYLYHYFVPLLLSFILFALAFVNIDRFWKWQLTEERKVLIMTVLGLLVFAGYQWMRPFAYYEPMTQEAVQRRAIFPLWELHCVGCEKVSGLVVPRN